MSARQHRRASLRRAGYLTPTLVQTGAVTGTNGGVVTLSAITPGNTIVAYAAHGGATATVSFVASTTFLTPVGADVFDSTVSTNIWRGTAPSGETQIQLLCVPGISATAVLVVEEWAGLSTTIEAGPSPASGGGNVTTLTFGPMGTTSHPALVVAAAGRLGNMGATRTWSSDTLTSGTSTGTGSRIMTGYLAKPTAGAYGTTATWTNTGRASGLVVALRYATVAP